MFGYPDVCGEVQGSGSPKSPQTKPKLNIGNISFDSSNEFYLNNYFNKQNFSFLRESLF